MVPFWPSLGTTVRASILCAGICVALLPQPGTHVGTSGRTASGPSFHCGQGIREQSPQEREGELGPQPWVHKSWSNTAEQKPREHHPETKPDRCGRKEALQTTAPTTAENTSAAHQPAESRFG